MRHLVLAHPIDPVAAVRHDEFLLGPDAVAQVLRAESTTRRGRLAMVRT